MKTEEIINLFAEDIVFAPSHIQEKCQGLSSHQQAIVAKMEARINHALSRSFNWPLKCSLLSARGNKYTGRHEAEFVIHDGKFKSIFQIDLGVSGIPFDHIIKHHLMKHFSEVIDHGLKSDKYKIDSQSWIE